MKLVLLAFMAITLTACSELSGIEESSTKTTLNEIAHTKDAIRIHPLATGAVDTAATTKQEVTQAEISQADNPSEVDDMTATTHSSISDELLLIAGVETPEELFASPKQQRVLMEHLIRTTFPDRYRTMLAIANCESRGLIHWLPDGSLRPHDQGASSAAGVFQVLRTLHGPEIQAKGLDLKDPLHYMIWVKYMVDRRPSLSDWAECLPRDMANR